MRRWWQGLWGRGPWGRTRAVVPGSLTVADPERGDVPGWVLVTLMTAGLVVALWAVAGPMLVNLFSTAISSVVGPGAG